MSAGSCLPLPKGHASSQHLSVVQQQHRVQASAHRPACSHPRLHASHRCLSKHLHRPLQAALAWLSELQQAWTKPERRDRAGHCSAEGWRVRQAVRYHWSQLQHLTSTQALPRAPAAVHGSADVLCAMLQLLCRHKMLHRAVIMWSGYAPARDSPSQSSMRSTKGATNEQKL